MTTATNTIEELANREYQYGFVTDVEAETVPKGLSEDVVRMISAKKNEPEWLLEWRLKAYRTWLTMKEPTWQNVRYPAIDYQDIIYYSAPKKKPVLNSLDEVDPEVRATFEKLGNSARRAEAAGRRRGRRGVRQRLGRHDVPGEAGGDGDHLLLVLRGGAGPSRARAAIPGHGRAVLRQLLRDAQLGGLQRRLVRLHPQGRPLSDGAVDLFPHQREEHRASSSGR